MEYSLRITVQRRKAENVVLLTEETLEVLFVKSAYQGVINCLDKDGKRSDETIVDMYRWNEGGITIKEIELRMPGTVRVRSTPSYSRTYIMTIINQDLKEIKSHTAGILKKVPEVSKDLDELNPSTIVYVDIETVADPESPFFARLIKVSEYKEGLIAFEFERMSASAKKTYSMKMSASDIFIRGMNTIRGSQSATANYKFSMGKEARFKAVELIKDIVGIKDKLPWRTAPVSRLVRSGGMGLHGEIIREIDNDPTKEHNWDAYGYRSTYSSREKEFFFKEFLGSRMGT